MRNICARLNESYFAQSQCQVFVRLFAGVQTNVHEEKYSQNEKSSYHQIRDIYAFYHPIR